MNPDYNHVMIIGAGPAGLAIAGCLRMHDIPFQILEQSTRIAESWHTHYDRLCLHTVKELSGLPHIAIPSDVPRYVPRNELISYYEEYANTLNIKPLFGERVVSVVRENNKWEIKTGNGNRFQSKTVVIATGANRVPFLPEISNEDKFKGITLHSKQYKRADRFYNQKVLVVGMGNSGAEIALDLFEHGIEVCISVRSGVNIVPRDLLGRPTQLTGKILAKLPFHWGDWLGKQIRNLVFGDLTRYGIPKVTLSPARQLRQTGRTPVIDIGTLEAIKSGGIKIRPEIVEFNENGVTFKDGKEMPFDSVIFATGYKPGLRDFIMERNIVFDENEVPASIKEGEPYSGLYYLGFNIYELDGILGTISRDSKWIADDIKLRN